MVMTGAYEYAPPEIHGVGKDLLIQRAPRSARRRRGGAIVAPAALVYFAGQSDSRWEVPVGRLWRRVKASVTIGAAWGFGWFSAGMALFFAGARADVPFPLGFGAFGFLAGTAFSGVLMLAERKRGFGQLSIPRFAAWGALGGLGLATLFGGAVYLYEGVVAPLVATAIVFPLAGAICASGTLALARMADGDGPVALDDGIDIDAIGLSPEEERKLLG